MCVRLPTESASSARRKPQAQSKVTTGKSLFIGDVDGRGEIARRFRDILAEIVSDLGGSNVLSEAQRQLARRAATISVQCEFIEAEIAAGGEISADRLDQYGTMTDRLGRALGRLGMKRVAKDITPLRDRLRGAGR
jgi:hypothetical protein